MKFGRLLEYHTIPEWAAFYVDYRLLKKLLATYQSSISGGINEITESLLGRFDAFKELTMELEMQSSRVKHFYMEKYAILNKEMTSVIEYISDLKRVSTLCEKETKQLLSMKERDDSQNRATSMQRAFTELHQRITWLEGFCEINYIALLKILTKLQEEGLKIIIEDISFNKWQNELLELKQNIYNIIADECMDGDLKAAQKLLIEAKYIKSGDIAMICCCLGIIVVMLYFSVYIVSTNDFTQLLPSLCIFRLSFCISTSVIFFSLLIYVLEKYSIN